MPQHTLPVLIYNDPANVDAPVCALALELNLRGFGQTDEEAVDALSPKLVECFATARHLGRPEVLTFLADEEFWERYEKARLRIVLKGVVPVVPKKDRVADVPVPSAEVIALYAGRQAPPQVH